MPVACRRDPREHPGKSRLACIYRRAAVGSGGSRLDRERDTELTAYTQDQIAAAIIAEGQSGRGDGDGYLLHPVISEKGIVIALATGLVESNLTMYVNAANQAAADAAGIPYDAISYDANSDGVFQQRAPWWGTLAQRMDPRLSAAMFYHSLVAQRIGKQDYNTDATSPGGWGQMVQQSAFPDRYDQQIGAAQAIYDRLAEGTAPVPTPSPVGPPPPETDLTQNNDNDESRQGQTPRLVILHTEEGGQTGSAFEQWMANNGVSYGYIVNPDGSVIDMETDDVASWSVLDPANEVSINICFAGSYSGWTRQQWLGIAAAIDSAAYVAVRECLRFNIPIEILVGADYPKILTQGGITDHNAITVTQLSPGSTHTDVGPQFPWDTFADALAAHTPGAPSPTPEGPVSNPPAIPKPTKQADQVGQLWDQDLIRWDFLGGRTRAEALGAIGAALKIPGMVDPLAGENAAPQ